MLRFNLCVWLYLPVPFTFGLLCTKHKRVLAAFETYDDAAGYAFNVCKFGNCQEFFIEESES